MAGRRPGGRKLPQPCQNITGELFQEVSKKLLCVSLMKMSPLTAVLKCPHYEKGHYSNESEREAEVPILSYGLCEGVQKKQDCGRSP